MEKYKMNREQNYYKPLQQYTHMAATNSKNIKGSINKIMHSVPST
jgi:hypothetical protein